MANKLKSKLDIGVFLHQGMLLVKVIPNAASTMLILKDDRLVLHVAAPPEKDKANKEVIRFFKKEYGLRVLIKSGKKSREKVLEVM